MADHPIETLMKTAMESIKDMIDVNTIVGDPVETPDGSVIMPVSRVSCGFAAGGADYHPNGEGGRGQGELPFGGGSGGGVSVRPVGFLVVGQNQIRLLPVDGNPIADRLVDLAPEIMDKIQLMMQQKQQQEQHPPQQNPAI
ncbi:MAG: GerW family sporulation protein [Thermacetogeniaceae bacterium]|nr:sporulation protein YtfJ [Syntrophomonadaceae bacterium]